MQFFALLATLLALFAPGPAQPLQVKELNTHPFLCDGVNHELPTELEGVRVRKVSVWFGAYDYTNADIVFSLEHVRGEDWQSIAKAGWDHYATPTGVNGQVLNYDFTPDAIAIGQGEQLELYYQCNAMNEESKGKKAHLIVLVYYLK